MEDKALIAKRRYRETNRLLINEKNRERYRLNRDKVLLRRKQKRVELVLSCAAQAALQV